MVEQTERKKKIPLKSEVAYVLAILMLSFAVAVLTVADFGLSMIVSPAYLLSLKTGKLTFGQAEYVLQAVLFIVFLIVMRKFKVVYLSSFITCLIYGFALDTWRKIPCFNPSAINSADIKIGIRAVAFIGGIILTSFSIALFYKTYFYPQVYDFFVKGVSGKYGIKTAKFKTAFDIAMLIISVAMSLIFFKGFVGVKWGTLVMAAVNGTLIGWFLKLIDKFFAVEPIFKSFAAKFKLDKKPSDSDR